MAILSPADRVECWTDFMRTPDAGELFGLSKADLRAAVDAMDQWLSDNAAALNTALPQPARGALTTPQKARLLIWLVRWRYLKGV
jgi:hypothetical protein